ncbi:MAG: SH3 domain-containing protein, partial [Lachnospiraceae bacterium]|nr:SH3 domain-containing protein [Lachnospiraceae bacterium]
MKNKCVKLFIFLLLILQMLVLNACSSEDLSEDIFSSSASVDEAIVRKGEGLDVSDISSEDVTIHVEVIEAKEDISVEIIKPEESIPQYSYSELHQIMYATQSVNIRTLPSTDGEKIGGLTKAQKVTVTGQCNETGWYQIFYNGKEAYVSNNYLTLENPTVMPTDPGLTNKNQEQSSS